MKDWIKTNWTAIIAFALAILLAATAGPKVTAFKQFAMGKVGRRGDDRYRVPPLRPIDGTLKYTRGSGIGFRRKVFAEEKNFHG